MKLQEIARVTLQNEMDLILAHKRSMRLAELAGLSISAQTTFATAVSEVARNTIENSKAGCLILQVQSHTPEKFIVASLKDEDVNLVNKDGFEYAKKLVNKYDVSTDNNETNISLFFYIPAQEKIDLQRIDEWRMAFRNEPPLSPYEEIKKKN
jgi:hypothetical protein